MTNFTNKIESLFSLEPFIDDLEKRKRVFSEAIKEAFDHHYQNNLLFRNYCNKKGYSPENEIAELEKLPYLPVNIFKEKNMISVPESDIKKTLHSSSTTGIPSTVLLDNLTMKRQNVAAIKVMSSYLGNLRKPFIILDQDPAVKSSDEISARSAATRGFLNFASNSQYFLNEEIGGFKVDFEGLIAVLEKYQSLKQEVYLFGFTFIIYNYLIRKLTEENKRIKLPTNSKLIHIGGWKKLENQKIEKKEFLKDINNTLSINEKNVLDFYGFTEQMGLVYANTGDDYKICPVYSEIIIRDFNSLKPVPDGEIGLIQILTPLPNSYPGISILTEDVGKIISRNENKNERFGTRFEILGRAKKAEARGCGDILAEIVN